MLKKFIAGALVCLSLFSVSCYPELSVQQYDQLKKDLEDLDTQRAQLEVEVQNLKAEIATISAENNATNIRTRAYIAFLEKMISTQSSARILNGEFDVDSLVTLKDDLVKMSDTLDDPEIAYFIGLMNSDNESQTVAAYYKTIEYCFKEIKKQAQ